MCTCKEKPEVNVRYLPLSLPLYFVRQGLSLNLGGHWFGLTGHPSSPKDSAVSTSPAGIRRVDYGSLFCCFFFFLQVLGLNVGPHVGMTIALLTGSSCQLPLTLFLPHIEFCCLWKLAKLEHQSQNFHLKSVWPHPHLSVSLASDAHCNSFSQPPALPFLQFFSSMIQTQISSCFTIQVPCLASP